MFSLDESFEKRKEKRSDAIFNTAFAWRAKVGVGVIALVDHKV
jgi:hypothetical protein